MLITALSEHALLCIPFNKQNTALLYIGFNWTIITFVTCGKKGLTWAETSSIYGLTSLIQISPQYNITPVQISHQYNITPVQITH